MTDYKLRYKTPLVLPFQGMEESGEAFRRVLIPWLFTKREAQYFLMEEPIPGVDDSKFRELMNRYLEQKLAEIRGEVEAVGADTVMNGTPHLLPRFVENGDLVSCDEPSVEAFVYENATGRWVPLRAGDFIVSETDDPWVSSYLVGILGRVPQDAE
jgi:hypothetical protein